MKKNFLWMLAAILFCGAMTTVLTACGGSDNDSPTDPTPSQPETKEYTVTLDLVVHERAFNMMTLDFIYTDANGKENKMHVDKSTTSNAQLTEMEKSFFAKDPQLEAYRDAEAEQKYPGINDYMDTKHLKVYRVTLDKVASGKTITTTATTYILDSYQPKESNDWELMPTVIVAEKNSGNFLSTAALLLRFFGANNWDKLKERMNGGVIGSCVNTVVLP